MCPNERGTNFSNSNRVIGYMRIPRGQNNLF